MLKDLIIYIYVNIVVDVAFKLSIDNVDAVDNEFKLLKMVVDVAFKSLIDNVDAIDKSFKLLFMANVEPLTVNDDKTLHLLQINYMR